ncbi:hypothetical protein SAMN05421504_103499 [Amycolatopsis xylanica]|uniref:Uncharacterized protein n=1 Tax=Amycolatopsis xylanica TaxID=589385 RepID=A0A1H3DSB8_9PSEU|nr:hypothetical protein SAMN05421504_103499 [Amycolatopsis xylanica]
MFDITKVSDAELLATAGAATVEFALSAVAPSVMTGEPCD